MAAEIDENWYKIVTERGDSEIMQKFKKMSSCDLEDLFFDLISNYDRKKESQAISTEEMDA